MAYAANTSVSVERTRAELERLLQRAGASQFVSGWDSSRAAIGFVYCNRRIQFVLDLPDQDGREFWRTETGKPRSETVARKAWEQACRSRWRALLLTIKAKLEAIEVGISTFEEEFLAWTVIPGTSGTVYQEIGPRLADAIETGEPPRLLLGPGGR